jgi:hypothetical protein
MRGYWKLRQKSLDRNLGRTIFVRIYGIVASESTEIPHLTLQKCHNIYYRNPTTETTEMPQQIPQKYNNRDYSNAARYTTDMPQDSLQNEWIQYMLSLCFSKYALRAY